ncbi:hypothetical protein PIB30_072556 [Stylosanthes scabra]|uniref:GH18 domain-containing protein n=1 Tax=Stylosanthes scabra TaxID=79078 RepID=A0ABU6XM08_9FABA|nr:hypothetical protein [Stylosanthes scabra]
MIKQKPYMVRVNLHLSYVLWLIYFIFGVFVNTTQADDIGVYLGKNDNEETLANTRASRKYFFLSLAFLTTFGNGGSAVLNLAGQCNASSKGCTGLSLDIKNCQKQGIKVMLAIGGGSSTSELKMLKVLLSICSETISWVIIHLRALLGTRC